jgi:septum formation protein
MVAMSSITEGGNNGRNEAFGHGHVEGQASGTDPLNREPALHRTETGSETFLEQGTKVVATASGRNSDRLNPKENGMIATLCTTMDALEQTINTKRELKRAGGLCGAMPRVLLASQSPRRRRMLTEHGIEHTAVVTGLDDAELVRGGVTPAEWVAALAFFKAAAARERLVAASYSAGELIVLGADTVVRKGDQIIGQPRDAADAERIVRILQNGEHDVLTGVAFIDAATGKRDMWVDRSRVRVGDIGDSRISSYVAGTDWRGKAGAYNLSERLADGWPIEFEGDPGTIMGLPMEKLAERLMKFRDACIGVTAN